MDQEGRSGRAILSRDLVEDGHYKAYRRRNRGESVEIGSKGKKRRVEIAVSRLALPFTDSSASLGPSSNQEEPYRVYPFGTERG